MSEERDNHDARDWDSDIRYVVPGWEISRVANGEIAIRHEAHGWVSVLYLRPENVRAIFREEMVQAAHDPPALGLTFEEYNHAMRPLLLKTQSETLRIAERASVRFHGRIRG